MTSTDIQALANVSGKLHLERGITGILICKDGSALHILEGEKAVVLERFNTLKTDPYASYVLPMIEREVPEREFSNWTIGYKNAATTDFTFEIASRSFSDIFPATTSSEVTAIAQTFAQVNSLF